MPYVDDLVANESRVAEVSASEITGVKVLAHEAASKLFPGIELPSSEYLSFLEFVFCNSMPKRNKRGRTFTPAVLSNSFASLNDQLIDYEHLIGANNTGSQDRIIGHVKATRFNMPVEIEKASAKEIASLTDPIPAYGLGVLFNRANGVDKIISNRSGRPWKTSMECGHVWRDAFLLYAGEFIPIKDAEIAMRDCISANSVKPFKNRELTVCLGGLNGSVDFWGLGLTQSPADGSADILSIVSGRGPELASKNIFYMPMMSFSETAVEVANEAVDKILEEYASISIVGETCPDCEGGHTHQILSNLQILPAQGHSHHGSDINIVRGSNPRITGVTDTHSRYDNNPEVSSGNRVEHRHMINVPLKGKYPSDPAAEKASELASQEKEATMAKKLEELLPALEALVSKASKLGEGESKTGLEQEIASLRNDITAIAGEKASEEDRKKFLTGQIAAGNVVTKEVAEAATAKAVEDLKKENEKTVKENEIRTARLLKCTEANIDLDIEFQGILAQDGKPMTLRKRVEMISPDEVGEQQFNMDLSTWAMNPGLKKEPVISTPEQPEVKKAEAANTGEAKTVKKVISLVGGASGGTETGGKEGEKANTETPAKKIPDHLMGRRKPATV